MLVGSTRSASGQSAAQPMRAEAKARYDAGMAHYRARRYREAIGDFQAAAEIDPRREILFAEAQATRLAGDCPRAVTLYERFLATRPPPQQVEATRIALDRCRTVNPIPAAPAPVLLDRPPPPSTPSPRPWYRDPWGALFVAGGAAVLVPATILFATSFGAARDARSAAIYGSHGEQYEAARRRWKWGLGGMVLGVALAGVGATRIVSVGLDRGGARLALAGSF